MRKSDGDAPPNIQKCGRVIVPLEDRHRMCVPVKKDVDEESAETCITGSRSTDHYDILLLDTKSAPYIACDTGTAPQYTSFYRKCLELKSELAHFSFALRTVGSSGPSIIATNAMIDKLGVLRDTFGVNAHFIFPEDPHLLAFGNRSSVPPTPELFANVYEDFAESLDLLADSLRDFNAVYYDDALMLLLFTLRRRFINEACLLRQTEKPSHLIQSALESWVHTSVVSLIKALNSFGEKGIPTILTSQHYQTARYLNMTTIATFLSGVTASMIQLSSTQASGALDTATNALFFMSLVFSTCSAVTSLLVMSWRSSIVRDPSVGLPPWAYAWLNSGPLYTVLLSAALFSVALCLYVLSTQNIVTTVLTLACSGFCAAVIVTFCMWYTLERWRFRKQAAKRGQTINCQSLTVAVIDLLLRLFGTLKRGRGGTKSDSSVAELGEASPVPATDTVTTDSAKCSGGDDLGAISNEAFLKNNADSLREVPFLARETARENASHKRQTLVPDPTSAAPKEVSLTFSTDIVKESFDPGYIVVGSETVRSACHSFDGSGGATGIHSPRKIYHESDCHLHYDPSKSRTEVGSSINRTS